MESKFSALASTKSNEELLESLNSREKYLPETVEAALAELQKRGRIYSDEQLKLIEDHVKLQRSNAAIGGKGSAAFYNNAHKYNLVEDPVAPLLYSRRALYGFSVFCGALFGSILLAINCNKLKNTAGVIWSLLFGITFTVIQIIGAGYANARGSYGVLCGLVSGLFIDYFLWNKLIGKSPFYKAKPIWIPLIIAVVLLGLILLVLIYGSEHA